MFLELTNPDGVIVLVFKEMFKLCPKCHPEEFREAVMKYKAKQFVYKDPIECPTHHVKLILFDPNLPPGITPLNYYLKTKIEEGEL